MTTHGKQMLRLPLSSLVVERFPDGCFSVRTKAEFDAYGPLPARHSECWTDPDDEEIGCRGEWPPREDAHEATWWCLFGLAAEGAQVDVATADGAHPPVIRLGTLWICEWLSVRREAQVTVGLMVTRIVHRQPAYLDDAD